MLIAPIVLQNPRGGMFLPAIGQTEDPSLLTLERIFSTREFRLERFAQARWLEDGSGYTTLEKSKEDCGGEDIVRYNPETGEREILVSAARLTPKDSTAPLEIDDYQWSPDGSILLVFTNTEKVWRRNTRGDYWILNLKNWKIEQLGGNAKSSTLMFAKFSPDGQKVGYVRDNNLYVENLSDYKIKQLTKDGSKTIINGTFDWVYEEELDLRDGFRWSPDSESIAFWQLDAEGVGVFYMINNTDSLYSKIIPVQYPKVGTTNSAGRVGVVTVQNGEIRWMKVPGDPRNNYIARMAWAASSTEIVIQHINRLQNTNRVMLGDIRTGNMKTVFTEKDDAWIDPVDDFLWFDDGAFFTWVSERSGWRHAYLVSRSGKEIRPITFGDFDVISIEKIDKDGGWLYYIASPENPAQQYLYRISLDGKGKPERLSPKNLQGSHSYQISQDARWALHRFSSFDVPTTTQLIRLPEHETVHVLVDNKKLKNKVIVLKRKPTEFFRVDIGDGIELDGFLMKPYNFDPIKKYPVLFHVYGEPADQTVLDRWQGSQYLWHVLLTQQGYLVMSVDNRGTPCPRGRDWRKSIYRQIGILASKDQAAAAKAISKWSFVDRERIGIWGWSGGGSMTLNCLFRSPEIYKTGMSVAPVSNQRYYDTIYQERYMGLPKDNEEGFRDGSPITFAHQLEGNLLIVHGTGDDNVHFQNTEAVINELIKHNKRFTMMAYPNRSHSIREGENTTRHLYELLTRYLNENLPAGPLEQ